MNIENCKCGSENYDTILKLKAENEALKEYRLTESRRRAELYALRCEEKRLLTVMVDTLKADLAHCQGSLANVSLNAKENCEYYRREVGKLRTELAKADSSTIAQIEEILVAFFTGTSLKRAQNIHQNIHARSNSTPAQEPHHADL